MKILTRLSFAIVLVGTLAVLLWRCLGGPLDCASWAQSWQALVDVPGFDGGYSEQFAAAENSIAAKTYVATELAGGRLTLWQAAAQIRRLHRERPDFNWEAFRQCYPGASDAERHAWEAVQAVRALLNVRPGRVPTVVARLEAELHDRLARQGTVSLDPDGRNDGGAEREAPGS